jgi:hypothetical protein
MWTLPPDAERLPSSGEGPDELWHRSQPLRGSEAEAYLAKRRVPLGVAEAAEVRFTEDLEGRTAVLARLTGPSGELRAVHGRYLHNRHGEGKMLTVGRPGGVFAAGGLDADPLVLVEGVFDALSLAAAGLPAVATIGRWVDWLPAGRAGRDVWLAFDGNRPGERWAVGWAEALGGGRVLRLRPPGGRGDWNSAARRIGAADLERWIRRDAARHLEVMG